MQHVFNSPLRHPNGKKATLLYAVSDGDERRYYSRLREAVDACFKKAMCSSTSVFVTLSKHRSNRTLRRATLAALMNGDAPPFGVHMRPGPIAVDDGVKLAVLVGLVEPERDAK